MARDFVGFRLVPSSSVEIFPIPFIQKESHRKKNPKQINKEFFFYKSGSWDSLVSHNRVLFFHWTMRNGDDPHWSIVPQSDSSSSSYSSSFSSSSSSSSSSFASSTATSPSTVAPKTQRKGDFCSRGPYWLRHYATSEKYQKKRRRKEMNGNSFHSSISINTFPLPYNSRHRHFFAKMESKVSFKTIHFLHD